MAKVPFALRLVLACLLVLVAACSDDDSTRPTPSRLCHGLLPNEIMPTDEDANVIASGGEDQWCPIEGGPEMSTPGWEPAYPNPFNPTTKLVFKLPSASHVTIRIYDAQCEPVRTLVDQPAEIGEHHVLWDATDDGGRKVADGYYVCVLTVGDFECAGVVQLSTLE